MEQVTTVSDMNSQPLYSSWEKNKIKFLHREDAAVWNLLPLRGDILLEGLVGCSL